MLERFLIGLLAFGLSDQAEHTRKEDTTDEITSKVPGENFWIVIFEGLQAPGKFHIGMLSLSLIVGLAFGGFISYNCWTEKNVFLSYIRNLVIALVCRTFFSIIFEGVIILGTPTVGGGNTLLAFECISSSLVLAFWLTLTIYLHARVQRDFNSEPTLLLYQFGVPSVAVFFSFVWIFVMQGAYPDWLWVYIGLPFASITYSYALLHWVVNSFRLLYLLIQLGLVVDAGRMVMKMSVDNDSVSLLRKIGAMMGTLVFLFWLQFGLSLQSLLHSTKGYIYFFYFVDGLQCGLVCLVMFFFSKWVPKLNKTPPFFGSGELEKTNWSSKDEVLLNGTPDRRIVTIDSVFMTRESGSLGEIEPQEKQDVVYSSVVQPHTLRKTIDLYKRLNVLPTNEVTVYDGDEFFDCDLRSKRTSESGEGTTKRGRNSDESKNGREGEKVQKKNAFYSSKYLIIDSKEEDIPKLLETRPPGKESPKQDNSDMFSTNDFVHTWLNDNIEKTEKESQTKFQVPPIQINEEDKKTEVSTNTNLIQSVLSKIISVVDINQIKDKNETHKIESGEEERTAEQDDFSQKTKEIKTSPVTEQNNTSKEVQLTDSVITEPKKQIITENNSRIPTPEDHTQKPKPTNRKNHHQPESYEPDIYDIPKIIVSQDSKNIQPSNNNSPVAAPRLIQQQKGVPLKNTQVPWPLESDSEFEIEKRRNSSSSSASSFSIDKYYAKVTAAKHKFISSKSVI